MIQKRRLALPVILLLPCIALSAHAAGPAAPADDASGGNRFQDLSKKEHCITNLVLSYAERDIDRFSELLHEDYCYHGPGDEIRWNASEERERTALLFASDRMQSFEIGKGEWKPVRVLFDNPCDACWESTREYTVSTKFSPDGDTVTGGGYTKFIVAAVEENGELKYKILAIIDLGREKPE